MAAGTVGKCLFFHLLFHSILLVTGVLTCKDISVSNLSSDITFEVPRNKSSNVAVCVHGGALTLSHIWGSVKVLLEFGETEVQFYEPESCSALNPVNQSWASVLQSFVTSRDVMDHIVFKHSPFRTSCSAVKLIEEQDVRINVAFQVIDWYFPATFLAGLIIFYNAERLSRNSVFFYSSGVSLGLIMSLLMLVYILHRLIPGRGGAYAVLIGGWSLAAYLIQWTWGNLKDLIVNHNQWVIGYLVVVGIISFCVCYYHGPVTSDRGLDLIRWMLQLVGLTLLYMGTRSDVVSFGVISTVFLSHVIRSSDILMGVIKMMPRHWVSYRVYYFFFPPKHKFLSQEEYVIQGSQETSRALDDLREYCNSPECNTWQVVSRLKHPSRFASFVASGQHILEEEMKIYDYDPTPWLTSDSDGNDSDPNNDL